MLDIPEWTVVLYDLTGNPVMDISKFVRLSLDLKLNDNSTLSFTIDLEQFEKLCAGIGATPRNLIYPAKTEVKVYRNGVALFGGIIATADSTLSEDTKSLDITADSYLQYFAKRFVSKTYTNTDRSQIAWDAINTVQSVTNGNLGVTQGTLATIFNSDLTCDFRDVKSIIQLYTYAQPSVYDFEITPDKVFNTYERLGSDKPEVVLAYPENVVSMKIPRSSDTLYNKVIGLGSGIGDERIQSIQEDADSQAIYRVQEYKTTFNSVIIQGTLDENTKGVLEQSRAVLVLPELSVRGSALDISSVFVGDSITVRTYDQTYNDDVNALLRIYGLTVNVDENISENISVNFYKPDNGGEIEE